MNSQIIALFHEWWPWLLPIVWVAAVFALVSTHHWLREKSTTYRTTSKRIADFIGEVVPVVGGMLVVLVLMGGILRSCTQDDCGAQEAKYAGCD